MIGLPVKNGIKHALYAYEREVYDSLSTNKHIWIKKATGLGITEFILRYIAWLSVYDYTYQLQSTQFAIVTGPNEELAIRLIKRFKELFTTEFNDIEFNSDVKTAVIGNVEVHAYPSNHMDSMRSLTNPKFIFLDEADFFRPSEQQNARDASERYIAKSNPWIVMVSTPNQPDGLFAQIEHEDPSIYNKLHFSYHVGLGNIYTQEEIQKSKGSPSFEREYNLKYLGKIGNVFPQSAITNAISLGDRYKSLPINQYTVHFAGLDPGFSKITPLYIAELNLEHQIVRIIYYEGFDNKTTPEQIANRIHQLHRSYINLWWFIDGSNRGLVNQIKTKYGESTIWDKPDEVSTQSSRIIPINFATEHKALLEHCYLLVSDGHVAIPKEYDRLITSLRTAQASEWSLNKEETTYDDDLDSLRLLLKRVYFEKPH